MFEYEKLLFISWEYVSVKYGADDEINLISQSPKYITSVLYES